MLKILSTLVTWMLGELLWGPTSPITLSSSRRGGIKVKAFLTASWIDEQLSYISYPNVNPSNILESLFNFDTAKAIASTRRKDAMLRRVWHLLASSSKSCSIKNPPITKSPSFLYTFTSDEHCSIIEDNNKIINFTSIFYKKKKYTCCKVHENIWWSNGIDTVFPSFLCSLSVKCAYYFFIVYHNEEILLNVTALFCLHFNQYFLGF